MREYSSHPTPALAFLIGRQIKWLEDNDGSTKFWIQSGTIINASDDAVLVHLDNANRKQALHCYTLAHAALEKSIQIVMERCAIGPSNKALLNDKTPHEIYALVDPRTNEIRYVGMSKNANQRFTQHLRGNSSTPRKDAWIYEMQSLGLQPHLIILGFTENRFQALMQEEYWIHYYIEQGADLTNNENKNGGRQ